MPIALGEPFSFEQRPPEREAVGEIESETHTRVAILGAGLAGLSCAHRLLAASERPLTQHDLLVLERETHPGGRVRTLQVGVNAINLGALTFQPEHYHRYNALLADLGLRDRVRIVSRRRMAFGAAGRATRADNVSLLWDMLRGLVGQGVYTPREYLQLLRFYFFLQRVTAPRYEDELMALHAVSVAEWARGFGFDESVHRKFVGPLVHYCFRAPEEVSAAFGVFLLGFNLSRPATLTGGFGQVTDAMAARLGALLQTGAEVVRVARSPQGFAVTYVQAGASRCVQASKLVMAVPANVAAALLPEMRARAASVEYGSGRAMVVSGNMRADVDLQLHMRVEAGRALIYGGEAKADGRGGHIANVLTYAGETSEEAIAMLFEDGRYENHVAYKIDPASAAPAPGQQPLPVDWGEGLYLAGDCAGLFASQETAVETGEAAAALLRPYLN